MLWGVRWWCYGVWDDDAMEIKMMAMLWNRVCSKVKRNASMHEKRGPPIYLNYYFNNFFDSSFNYYFNNFFDSSFNYYFNNFFDSSFNYYFNNFFDSSFNYYFNNFFDSSFNYYFNNFFDSSFCIIPGHVFVFPCDKIALYFTEIAISWQRGGISILLSVPAGSPVPWALGISILLTDTFPDCLSVALPAVGFCLI